MKLASSLESYWPVQAVAVLEEEPTSGAETKGGGGHEL